MTAPLKAGYPAAIPDTASPEPPPRRARKGWLAISLAGLIAGGVWLGVALIQEKSAVRQAPQARTVQARVSDLEVRARVSGTSSAREYAVVVAPLLRGPENDRAMSLIKLAGNGSMVRKGDLVAEFDPTQIRDHLDDVRDRLEERRIAIRKLRVQHELEMADLRQRLERAQAAGEKARLDLRTGEVRSDIQRENFRLAVEEADAVVQQLKAQIQLKREAHAAEMRIAQIAEKLEIDHVARHEVDEKRLKVTAPMDGMVVVLARDSRHGERKTYGEGDLVTPGTPIIQIVDRRTLQIEASVNQAEVTRFRLGQKATIGFDAYPGREFRGEVSAIGALATLNGRQQYFVRQVPLRVRIENNDQQIIPDLSGYANVVLDRMEDAVVIPESAVEKAGGAAFVEVREGEGFVRRPVQLGLSDGVNVAVLEGLEEGEIVRLSQEK